MDPGYYASSLISRYGEGYVMMWGYFNSKGQGNFIRMHSVLDPQNNWPLKIKIKNLHASMGI